MTEFNLSSKFKEERVKINVQMSDRLSQAQCHTTINQIEKDVKEAVKRLKYKLCGEWSVDAGFNERWIDKIFGDKLI